MNQMRRIIPNKNYMHIELIRPETSTSRMRNEMGMRLVGPDNIGSITWVQDIHGDTYWRYGGGEGNLRIIQRRMERLGLQMISDGLSEGLNDFPMTRNAYHVFI